MDFKQNIKITSHFWLSLRKSIFVFIPIVALLAVPFTTNAGLLTLFSDIFSGTSAEAQSETFIGSSSEEVALLEPVLALEPNLKAGSDIVVVGEEALLPEVGPLNEAPEKIDTNNGQISVYIVRSGDTLAGIAQMFDVSANTILWANDLVKGSALKVGQSLVILPISGVMHTVVSGDTLNSIAKKYSGDVAEIASFNDLSLTDKLAVGDTVVIPDGEGSFSTRPSKVSGTVSGQTAKLVSSASGPEYVGYYQKPFLVGHKTQGLHGYNGVDYGMPVGSPIYAAAAGIVIISKNSGYNGGYGDYVAIQHLNSTQTVYGHMSNPVVSVGQSVTQGQLIGYSGNTGKSTGPHLHFEIRGAKNPF